MSRSIVLILVLAVSLVSLGAAAVWVATPEPRYTTWESLEPDIWASAWLINRFIDPKAEIVMTAEGDPMPRGIAFGTPDSAYNRASGGSAFAGLVAAVPTASPALLQLAEAISFIESASWQAGSNPPADVLERQFRRLQDRFGRAYVPISCYAEFFDVAYEHIASTPDALDQALEALVARAACDRDVEFVGKAARTAVAQRSIDSLLTDIAAGQKVVFVDTREPAEFREGHVPGAINLPLRQIDAATVQALQTADTVIAYCIKDFRGFEAARELKRQGVAGAATMMPYGLAGWRQAGLPIAVGGGEGDAAALDRLVTCAKDRAQCPSTSQTRR